jgi:hypothetical protein
MPSNDNQQPPQGEGVGEEHADDVKNKKINRRFIN